MSYIAESLEILVPALCVLVKKTNELTLGGVLNLGRLKCLEIYIRDNLGKLDIESDIVAVNLKLDTLSKKSSDLAYGAAALLERYVKIKGSVTKLGENLDVPAKRHLVVGHLGDLFKRRQTLDHVLDSLDMYGAVEKRSSVYLDAIELRDNVRCGERRSLLVNLSLGLLVFYDHVIGNGRKLLLDALLESLVGNVLLYVLINNLADLFLEGLLILLRDFGELLLLDYAGSNRYINHIGNVLSEVLGGLGVVYNVLKELVIVLRVGAVVLVLDIELERSAPNVLFLGYNGSSYNGRGYGSCLFFFQLRFELICNLINNELLGCINDGFYERLDFCLGDIQQFFFCWL